MSQAYDLERLKLLDDARAQMETAQWLTKELKQIDPYLSVVFVDGSRLEDWELLPGMHRQRWHVRRENPETVDTYWPIMGPEGEYVEPSSKLIEDMKAADLWRDDAFKEMQRRQDRELEAQRKQNDLEKEGLRDNAAATFRAVKRLPGEGGMNGRWWGRGRVKGVVGH